MHIKTPNVSKRVQNDAFVFWPDSDPPFRARARVLLYTKGTQFRGSEHLQTPQSDTLWDTLSEGYGPESLRSTLGMVLGRGLGAPREGSQNE